MSTPFIETEETETTATVLMDLMPSDTLDEALKLADRLQLLEAGLAEQDAAHAAKQRELALAHEAATAEVRGVVDEIRMRLNGWIVKNRALFLQQKTVKSMLGVRIGLRLVTRVAITDAVKLIRWAENQGEDDLVMNPPPSPCKAAIERRLRDGDTIPFARLATMQKPVVKTSTRSS